MGTLILFRQVTPATNTPFRIVEVMLTVDGPRWRLTSHTYRTEDEALRKMERLEKKPKETKDAQS